MKKIRTRVGVLLASPQVEEKNNQGHYESLQKDREQRLVRGTPGSPSDFPPAFVPQPRCSDNGPGNRWSQLSAA